LDEARHKVGKLTCSRLRKLAGQQPFAEWCALFTKLVELAFDFVLICHSCRFELESQIDFFQFLRRGARVLEKDVPQSQFV